MWGCQVGGLFLCPLQQTEEMAGYVRTGICFNSLKDTAADALLWHASEALKNKQKIGYNSDSRRVACG